MTADRGFKRLVRARARRTGESYASARRALLATRSEDRMTVVQVDGDAPVKVLVEGVNTVEAERTFVLLKETGGERRLQVFIGPPEATAIAFAMQGVPTVRPRTYDALKQTVEALGGRLDRIVVGWRAETTTFTADVVVLLPDGAERHFDWRVSDALAIAVRCTPPPAILVPSALLCS